MHIRRIVFVGLSVLAAPALRPVAAPAIEHQSARISSLGGDHVAGVIPDLYTDIGVNPACALFADRLNASYARRYDPGYAPSVPYLMEGSGSVYRSSMMVDELSAWGIRLSSWRAAAFVQWALYRPERVMSYPETGFNGTGAYSQLTEDAESSNNDFARIDLVAARPLGDRYALGLRVQGKVYNDYSSDMRVYATEQYYDPFFAALYGQRRETRAQSYMGRLYSLDVQAGIAKSDDTGPRTDFAVTASLNKPDHRRELYELDISKEYDQMNEIDGYSYYRYYWNDAREGDLWTLALMFRHSFDNGFRLLAGGSVSTCAYETDWSSSEEVMQWGWMDTDFKVTGAFKGDGSLLDGSCYVKGNKVFSVHRTVDLFLGLHGVFARIRAEEEPLVHYAIRGEEGESAVEFDQAVRLESIEESFALYVPLSVEFRPSSWFTYFSSFVLSGEWRKVSATQPIPSLFTFRPPASVSRVGGADLAGASPEAVIEPRAYSTDWRRELSTDATVTLGFSLHYGDRFFVDVYTESDIVPTYLGNNVIDVRYAF
jgi:hypothetical protein